MKKKKHAKKKIALPIHPSLLPTEPVELVPLPLDIDKILPLSKPVPSTLGVITLVEGWAGPYYTFAPYDGRTLEGVTDCGMMANLQLSLPNN